MTQKKKRSWSDLRDRLLSAIVLIPIVALIIYLGGMISFLLAAVMLILATREWEKMIGGNPNHWFSGSITALLVIACIAYPLYGLKVSAIFFALATLVAAIPFGSTKSYLWRAFGIGFFSIFGLALLMMRGLDSHSLSQILQPNLSPGPGVYLFLLSAVWMTDSGAYFLGRQIGGAKLNPEISPSKTWSGAIGGLCIGVLGATICWIFVSDSPFYYGTGIALVLSLITQFGDLAESAAKRFFAIKDTGEIIPGHGGLLDRIDGLTFAAIALCALGIARAGVHNVPAGILNW